jgi:hypothetical protein
MENPALLDVNVVLLDEEMEGWVAWDGNLQVTLDGEVGLAPGITDEEAAEIRREVALQQQNMDEIRRQDQNRRREELIEAERKGILP